MSLRSPIGRRFFGAFALCWAMALAGCGGGGGGGGEDDAHQAVTVVQRTAQEINGIVGESYKLADISISGTLTGDFKRLEGKTVYVSVVDPDDLFEDEFQVNAFGGSPNWSVDLTGRHLVAAGLKTGFVELHACLDLECKKPLDGSPVRVPYRVEVTAGLSLTTTTVEAATDFGTNAQSQDFVVRLPDNAIRWIVDYVSSESTRPDDTTRGSYAIRLIGDGTDPGTGIDASDPTKATVRVGHDLAYPGTYTNTYRVRAVSPQGSWEQEFNITYTVNPRPDRAYWINQPSHQATVQYGTQMVPDSKLRYLLNEGTNEIGWTSDLLSHPPEATGNPALPHWYRWGGRFIACIGTSVSSPPDCLPVGTYEAEDRLTYQRNGQTGVLVMPATMTIVP